jgi:hypothetical protein
MSIGFSRRGLLSSLGRGLQPPRTPPVVAPAFRSGLPWRSKPRTSVRRAPPFKAARQSPNAPTPHHPEPASRLSRNVGQPFLAVLALPTPPPQCARKNITLSVGQPFLAVRCCSARFPKRASLGGESPGLSVRRVPPFKAARQSPHAPSSRTRIAHFAKCGTAIPGCPSAAHTSAAMCAQNVVISHFAKCGTAISGCPSAAHTPPQCARKNVVICGFSIPDGPAGPSLPASSRRSRGTCFFSQSVIPNPLAPFASGVRDLLLALTVA